MTIKSEAQVVRECRYLLDLLRSAKELEYKIIHVPLPRGGYQQGLHAQQMRGISDCLIFLPKMRVLHIEFKRPKGGHQSEAQKEWADDLNQIGHVYRLVTSCGELEEILKAHGVRMFRWYQGDLVPVV